MGTSLPVVCSSVTTSEGGEANPISARPLILKRHAKAPPLFGVDVRGRGAEGPRPFIHHGAPHTLPDARRHDGRSKYSLRGGAAVNGRQEQTGAGDGIVAGPLSLQDRRNRCDLRGHAHIAHNDAPHRRCPQSRAAPVVFPRTHCATGDSNAVPRHGFTPPCCAKLPNFGSAFPPGTRAEPLRQDLRAAA